MFQGWFANRGQVLQLAVATISLLATIGFFRVLANPDRHPLLSKVSAGLVVALLLLSLFVSHQDPALPHWVVLLIAIFLVIVAGAAGRYAFPSRLKWKPLPGAFKTDDAISTSSEKLN